MTNEHTRIAKSVTRMLYTAGILSGDQYKRSLECLEAAIKYTEMGTEVKDADYVSREKDALISKLEKKVQDLARSSENLKRQRDFARADLNMCRRVMDDLTSELSTAIAERNAGVWRKG